MPEIKKSRHFLQVSAWKGIFPTYIEPVLGSLRTLSINKNVIIVTPSFLQKNGLAADPDNCMIFIIKEHTLITGYWCDHPNYLFKKEKDANIQILY